MTARNHAKKTVPKATKQRKQREGSPKIQRWIDLLAALLRRKYPATFELRRMVSVTIDHPFADPDWAVRHVQQYGPDAEVLQPAQMRREIVGWLEAKRVFAQTHIQAPDASREARAI